MLYENVKCNEEHDGSFGSGRFCNIQCSTSFSTKSSSKDRNKKISRSLKGRKIAEREIRTCKFVNCNNTFEVTLKNTKEFCSPRCVDKQKTVDPLFRSRLSKSLKQAYKNGKPVYGGTTKWLTYKDIKVQGTYELRMCESLDIMKDIGHIADWEYTNDRFTYIGKDSKEHSYLLDFKVYRHNNSFYYVETKGYEKENDKLKWEAVRNTGHELQIFFDEDIKKLEKKLSYGDGMRSSRALRL